MAEPDLVFQPRNKKDQVLRSTFEKLRRWRRRWSSRRRTVGESRGGTERGNRGKMVELASSVVGVPRGESETGN